MVLRLNIDSVVDARAFALVAYDSAAGTMQYPRIEEALDFGPKHCPTSLPSNNAASMPARIQDEVLQQLDALIEDGRRVAGSYVHGGLGGRYSTMEASHLFAFVTAARAQVARIAGAAGEFLGQMIPMPQDGRDIRGNPHVVDSSLGALTALRSAVASGQLEALASRIRSAVHDDMLHQAVELLAAGYHVASMVLVGGVIENHLRNLCATRGLASRPQLGGYNDALRDVLYPQATWRRIQAIGDLRNNAAHGHLVLAPDVDDALRFVQRFMADVAG